MATIDQIVSLARALEPSIRGAWNLHPGVSERYALIDAFYRLQGGREAPRIISGFRSPRHNEDVGGATDSEHLRGRALDLDAQDPTLVVFAAIWRALGGRAGADFSDPDPNHFDIRGL